MPGPKIIQTVPPTAQLPYSGLCEASVGSTVHGEDERATRCALITDTDALAQACEKLMACSSQAACGAAGDRYV